MTKQNSARTCAELRAARSRRPVSGTIALRDQRWRWPMWRRDELACGGGAGPHDPVVLRWESGCSRTPLIEGVWHRHRARTCWTWWETGTVQGRLWCRCGAEWTGHRCRAARSCGRGGLRAARNEVFSR